MSISYNHKKLHRSQRLWACTHGPRRPCYFDIKVKTRSETEQAKITLKAASRKSKAPITLPKLPWDENQ